MKSNNRPLRLAAYFDQPLHSGGGHQQSLNILRVLKKIPANIADISIVTNSNSNAVILKSHDIQAYVLKINFFSRCLINLRNKILNKRISKSINSFFGHNKFENFFIKKNIDLVYFISPTFFTEYLDEINFISTVWDLCHLDYPEFPEVRAFKEFEIRELHYKSSLKKSIAVVVESELGRQNVIKEYNVKPERCIVLKLLPSISILNENKVNNKVDITRKFHIRYPYIFYPAQFWPHKNHSYILDGIKELENLYKLKISVIFSGSDRGNMSFIKEKTAVLGLTDRVHFVGFLPNSEISSVYKGAIALVMPTFFGPSNIPPLEAFTLGTPVLYSNLPDLKIQVGKAALLINLNDPKSMAKKIFTLIKNKEIRKKLIFRGKIKISEYNINDNVKNMTKILKDYSIKMRSWTL